LTQKSYTTWKEQLDSVSQSLEFRVSKFRIMIGGYTQNGLGKEAFEVFCQMIREGYKPDVCTFVGILHTCASRKALDSGNKIHARISTTGLESDVHVSTSLLKMYAKCGSLGDAQGVFGMSA
jgi:pentatricopeptide repeat protein